MVMPTGSHRSSTTSRWRTLRILVRLCDEAIAKYKAKRGRAIWEHRTTELGQVPGRDRYETLKGAGFRCELCGVSAEERALDVDHIHPRKGGAANRVDPFSNPKRLQRGSGGLKRPYARSLARRCGVSR